MDTDNPRGNRKRRCYGCSHLWHEDTLCAAAIFHLTDDNRVSQCECKHSQSPQEAGGYE